MHIKSVKLKNFGQFVDANINFNTTKDKMLVLIEGCNASGKTTIFNAIKWCLFGDLVNIHGTILNRKIFNKLDVGSEISVEVEVAFVSEDKEYKMRKIQKMKKIEDVSDVKRMQTLFPIEVYTENIDTNNNIHKLDNISTIADIVPAIVSDLMFIDPDGFRQFIENNTYVKSPIILDSPLCSFSLPEAKRICSKLTNISEQVIILSKDLDADLIKEQLSDYISDYAIINMTENSDGTHDVLESTIVVQNIA